MTNITKSIKRVQQDNFKKMVYMIIEKLQDQEKTADEIEKIIDDCFEQLQESKNSQRGRSGYNVFVSEKAAEMKASSTEKFDFKVVSKTIGDMWKMMTEKEKDIYREKAKNMPIDKKEICNGVKGNGDPCTNKTKPNSDVCGQHMPKEHEDVPMCIANTKKGTQCKRKVVEGQDLCKTHIKLSTAPISEAPIEKVKCQGLTNDKKSCKRNAINGKYCKAHAEKYGFQETGEKTLSYPKTVTIEDDTAQLFTYNNKQYYMGENDSACYNVATHAVIGFWDAETEAIQYD